MYMYIDTNIYLYYIYTSHTYLYMPNGGSVIIE
jgi:hypothetical protein